MSKLFSEIVKRQLAAHYVGYHQILTENQTNSTLVPSSHRDRQYTSKKRTQYIVTTFGYCGQIIIDLNKEIYFQSFNFKLLFINFYF